MEPAMKNVELGAWISGLAGRASGLRARGTSAPERERAAFEQLENRVLLSALDNFPASTGVPIAGGLGSVASELGVGEDELFNFVLTNRTWIAIQAEATSGDLDTRIELYRDSTLMPGTPMPVTNANNQPLASSNDGILTGPGVITDAWLGAVLNPGTYFVLVISENETNGEFSLNLDTNTVAGGTPDDTSGVLNIFGEITTPGQDTIYRVDIPDNDDFNGIATFNAIGLDTLDTKLDVFDRNGIRLFTNSQAGFFNDAFGVSASRAGETFYIRIRSDELAGPNAVGEYDIAIDAISTIINLDPVTRIGNAGGGAGGTATDQFEFTAQASGVAIINIAPAGFIPLIDGTISLYNENGTLLAFNDTFFGDIPKLSTVLTGGERYFVVIAGFDQAFSGSFSIQVESAITGNTNPFAPGLPDDHANYDPSDPSSLQRATPIVWSDPVLLNDVSGLQAGPELVDHRLVQVGQGWGRIESTNDSDLFVFVPPISMLGGFDGITDTDEDNDDRIIWAEGNRPSTRVELLVNLPDFLSNSGDIATPAISFLSTEIRVLDSRGNTVYVDNTNVFTGLFPPGVPVGNDPAGSLNPARWPPEVDAQEAGWTFSDDGVFSFEVWGGEAYFIEVRSQQATGRYNLEVIVDAVSDPTNPANLDPDGGELVDQISLIQDQPRAGNFTAAREITLPGPFFDRRLSDTLTTNGFFDRSSGIARSFIFTDGREDYEDDPDPPNPQHPRPSVIAPDPLNTIDGAIAAADGGIVILEEHLLPRIMHPLDTDVYFFRAPKTGAVEIRIQTNDLDDTYSEIIVDDTAFSTFEPDPDDPDAPPPDPTITVNNRNRNFDSPLDSALRIFNNDFQQIAYNNNNTAMVGATETRNVGTLAEVDFNDRDARVTFNVVQGEVYFIQVESGQREAYLANRADPTVPVDWMRLIGAYDVLITTVTEPSLSAIIDGDDFPDADINGVIPGVIGEFTRNIAAHIGINPNGNGTIAGTIQPNAIRPNPVDTDLFRFRAIASGEVTITVTPGPGLAPVVSLADNDGAVFRSEAAAQGQAFTFTFNVIQGDDVFLIMAGADGTTGAYNIAVDAPAFTDDHARFGDWGNATPIPLNDFLGAASVTGQFESFGDSDVFSIQPVGFGGVTVTVTDLVDTPQAIFEIYESTVDPVGNVVLRRIGFVDTATGTSRSFTFNPTPADQRVTGDLELPNYYIVVRGETDLATGTYRLDVTFDPTDDHADEGEFDLATRIPIDAETGAGAESGVIEKLTDSDIFVFTPKAQGDGTITVTGAEGFNPRVRIFFEGETDPVATFDPGSSVVVIDSIFAQGTDYYIVVDAGAGSTETGAYDIDVLTVAPDDHANAGAFDFATTLTFSTITGNAFIGATTPGNPGNPQIDYEGDTDLFTFVAIEEGGYIISVTPVGAPGYAPTLTIFNQSRSVIGTASAAAGGVVTFTTEDFAIGDRLYVLVGGTGTGEYRLFIDGPVPGSPGGPGGDPGEVDFENPAVPPINQNTGNARADGSINEPGDRALYTFVVPDAEGRTRLTDVYIKVFRTDGSALDATISVFGAPNELPQNLIAESAGPVPGSAATLEFQAAAGQQLWVIIAGIDESVGDFEIFFNAEPEVFTLYYPEGFASSDIREFISLANPNDYEVTYTLRVQYEGDAAGATIVSNVTLGAGARGGITLSDGAGFIIDGLTPDVPYAIILESDGPLAGTLSRYDFDSAVGDALTDVTGDTWTFARVERQPGSVFDFLVYYNPSPFEVDVTLTVALPDGGFFTETRTVGAERRGGWNIDQTAGLPVGIFGATIAAQATDAANDAAFQGIVASLTHYNQAEAAGFAILGDHTGGATTGAITRLINGGGVTAEITIHNPGDTDAVVTLNGDYIRVNLPDYFRVVNVPAGQTVVLRGAGIGFANNQPVGLTYTSDIPVAVAAAEFQLGEANANAGVSIANERWFFGDAFINSLLAGENYFETLAFYNPTDTDTTVTVELLFLNSDVETITIDLAAGGFAELLLHQAPEILNRADPLSYFSIVVSAPLPIVATLTHYDLFLSGGWSIAGSNIGIPTPFTLL
ncbi:MAG: hypothetical protein EA378_09060 [Phycisphaerales bacterium]|nr:MAG: hypothetical protein EA378_09060 [Phycisphaerales bacterium]